ncbi:MAG: ZPR1 zinc finger domain-containing protein [Methanobrevibacter sp.]|jgi:zinc finger protein|nr:ZPR1 zinc finger domain-containing protein [Methanobrevibacter sp.]
MKIDCPVCNGQNTADSIMKTENIPYFGEVMESTIVCSVCGYKHSDVISLDHKDPIRFDMNINKDTLDYRVVKAQSATVTIPELGLKVEPGPKSEGYISNVEGVLNRFEIAVKRALVLFEDEESQKNGNIILEKIKKVLNGELNVDLILEDPFGQSKVMGLNVKERPLSKEELKHLKTGFTIIDSDELEK